MVLKKKRVYELTHSSALNIPSSLVILVYEFTCSCSIQVTPPFSRIAAIEAVILACIGVTVIDLHLVGSAGVIDGAVLDHI
jgi:hypothetical protein